jgi:hypothetical protein
MSYQEIHTPEYYAEIDELLRLPQPCVHQDLLEHHRRASYGVRRERSFECPTCHQRLRDDSPLRVNDAPALMHVIISYGTFYLIYLLMPYTNINSDAATWVSLLTVFVYNFATRTPLKAVRNAILLFVAVDTVMIYSHFWRIMMEMNFSATVLHVVNTFIVALMGVLPIFISFAIHALIDRLKSARAEVI